MPTQPATPRTMTPEQIIAQLRRRPYDRAAQQAADLIEVLIAERERLSARIQ